MSDYETKEGAGSLFASDNKKTDKHPDYTGKCKINGKLMVMSAWINEAKSSGKKYMSLKFDDYKPKQTMEYTTTAPDNAEVPF